MISQHLFYHQHFAPLSKVVSQNFRILPKGSRTCSLCLPTTSLVLSAFVAVVGRGGTSRNRKHAEDFPFNADEQVLYIAPSREVQQQQDPTGSADEADDSFFLEVSSSSPNPSVSSAPECTVGDVASSRCPAKDGEATLALLDLPRRLPRPSRHQSGSASLALRVADYSTTQRRRNINYGDYCHCYY